MRRGHLAPPFLFSALVQRMQLRYAALMQRERLEYDVLIIGAGPAGLACAMSLAQAAQQAGETPAICVLEKAAEVGLHTISGAIIDPAALHDLIPGWRQDPAFPLQTRVQHEELQFLTARRAWRIPAGMLPPMLRHEGHLVGPLSALVQYLAAQAEAHGVEIFAGFAATQPLFDETTGALMGVVAGEAGLQTDGTPGPRYEPGMELVARFVVLAEGARGNITRAVAERFRLFRHPVHHALGLKELWELPRSSPQQAGHVRHTLGWPLTKRAAGGGFLYRQDERHIALGLVVHMDWTDPWLSPFAELQRFKTHPSIAPLLQGARRIGYGARAMAMADVRDIEALAFPGGVLVGDAFGLVNMARVQGVHAALHSGLLAGEALASALAAGERHTRIAEYVERVRASRFWQQLEHAANLKPLWARLGMAGVLAGGLLDLWSAHVRKHRLLPLLHHDVPDHAILRPLRRHAARRSPRPDGRLVFDRDNSLALSGVAHRKGQPVHLKVQDEESLRRINWQQFRGPEQRYCPAAVYRWQGKEEGRRRLIIQAENCLHCKACDIKDPGQNIRWTPPEGGDGPRYRGM